MKIRGATTLRQLAAARPRPAAWVASGMRASVAAVFWAAGYHGIARVVFVLAAIPLIASVESQVATAIVDGTKRWRKAFRNREKK